MSEQLTIPLNGDAGRMLVLRPFFLPEVESPDRDEQQPQLPTLQTASTWGRLFQSTYSCPHCGTGIMYEVRQGFAIETPGGLLIARRGHCGVCGFDCALSDDWLEEMLGDGL